MLYAEAEGALLESVINTQKSVTSSVWKSGTGVPPVNRAQDGRATINLN